MNHDDHKKLKLFQIDFLIKEDKSKCVALSNLSAFLQFVLIFAELLNEK